MDYILEFLTNNLFKILTILIVLVVGLVVIKFTLKFTKKRFEKSKIDPTMHRFILSIIKVSLYILLFVIVLQSCGVEMSSIVAVIGVAGLAISLAIQDTLANVASGFIILASKPFEKGNYVNLNGVEGEVAHITVMHTKLNTIDNKAIFVPNKLVVSEQITNFSRESNRRLELIFSIGYEDDFNKACEIIMGIIEKSEFTLKDPEPLVRMWAHSDSSIDIITRVWVETQNYLNLRFELLENVKAEFDKNSINIPYRHMNVILKNSD